MWPLGQYESGHINFYELAASRSFIFFGSNSTRPLPFSARNRTGGAAEVEGRFLQLARKTGQSRK
jgi:hypothetical protein